MDEIDLKRKHQSEMFKAQLQAILALVTKKFLSIFNANVALCFGEELNSLLAPCKSLKVFKRKDAQREGSANQPAMPRKATSQTRAANVLCR